MNEPVHMCFQAEQKVWGRTVGQFSPGFPASFYSQKAQALAWAFSGDSKLALSVCALSQGALGPATAPCDANRTTRGRRVQCAGLYTVANTAFRACS